MKTKRALIIVRNCIIKFKNTIFAAIKCINAKIDVNKREYVKQAHIQKSLNNGLP